MTEILDPSQAARAGGGGGKPRVGSAHARDVSGRRRRVAQAPGSGRIQSDDLSAQLGALRKYFL